MRRLQVRSTVAGSGDANGITVSIRRIGANPSSSEVTMWTSRNAIASSETLRCTASSTNRGMFGD